MGKGEIAHYEQFLLFPQCFQKACFPRASKRVIVWEWVNIQSEDTVWKTFPETSKMSFFFCLKFSCLKKRLMYSLSTLKNVLSLFLYLESFECYTTFDWLNHSGLSRTTTQRKIKALKTLVWHLSREPKEISSLKK